MGCFLGCFGSSKDVKKRPKTSHITSNQYPVNQNQYNPICPTFTSTVIANQDAIKTPNNLLVSETRTKEEEEKELSLTSKEDKFDEPTQLSSGTRKKVTFDKNIQAYEHVSLDDPLEDLQDSHKGGEKGVVVECSIEPIKSSSESEGGSTLSSLGLFPPNHRYQNCRESDDEDEGLDSEVSDFDEEEEDDGEYSDDEFYLREGNEVSARPCLSVESKTGSSPTYLANDQDTLDKEKSPAVFNRGVRDRAGYVHSVLNPVENTAQWKAVKVKATPTPPMKEQKENFLEEFGFEQSSTNRKSKLDGLAKHYDEVAVDASLSTWLASSLKTPPMSLGPILSGSSVSSKGSNSVTTQEESSTVEKIKQFSDPSFPRTRSPVGVQLNDTTPPVVECGSVSSFKGIPNSTSKYREDQKVKWHSTPFETRLERALDLDRGGAAKCDATRPAC